MNTVSQIPLTPYALAVATRAHKGQTRWDKSVPYIVHPVAVASIANDLYDKEHAQFYEVSIARDKELLTVVAYLHDAEEDVEGFDLIGELEKMVDAKLINSSEKRFLHGSLINLNKNNFKNYLDFTLAAKNGWASRLVKRADIMHNLATTKKGSMRDKYLLALHVLTT